MPNSIHETRAMDPEEACVARERSSAAGGEALRTGWLERSLREAFEHGEEDSYDEHEFKLAAAREMVLDLAPPGVAGPGERVLALHFVCAHNGTTIWLARAGARLLPRDARESAQRFACRLMDITARLQGALTRAAAERRKAEEMAERRALDRALRAKTAEEERERAVPPRVPLDLDDDPGDLEGAPERPARGTDPAAVARIMDDIAGLPGFPIRPEAPGEPAPSTRLNRRQRRAALRRLRKAGAAQGP